MELKYLKPFETVNDGVSEQVYEELVENRENARQELLDVIEYTVKNAEMICRDEKYLMHIPALMILAFWREKSAYKSIVEMSKLPPNIINPLLEDIITENLASILASVYDGNPELLLEIIENEDGESYVRNAAIDSLKILLAEGLITRDEVVMHFKRLFNEKIHLLDDTVIEHLIDASLEIHPEGLYDEIKRANDGDVLGWYSPEIDEWVDELKNRTIEDVISELKDEGWNRFVTEEDVLELANWLGTNGGVEKNGIGIDFYDYLVNDDVDVTDDEYGYDLDYESENSETVVKPPKIGRNDPCPCGSGKKYKKCCLGTK